MRRTGVGSAVVVIVAALGACGSGTTALDRVAGAAAKTTAAHTAKVSVSIKSDRGPFAKGFTEDGAFDFTNRRGRFDFNAAQLGTPGASGTISAVFDFSAGLVIYMDFPQLSQTLGGKRWLKIDYASFGKSCGVDFNSAIQNQSGDPTSGIEQLRGASQITKVGNEKVRGVDTTHYRLVIDLDKAVRASPAAVRDAMQKLRNLYTVKTVPAEVWIDSHDRARRYKTTIDSSTIKLPCQTAIASNPFTGTITTSYEVYDFGTVVDATPPPADQTTDLSALLGKTHTGTFAAVAQQVQP
jgi:hypothetical protein